MTQDSPSKEVDIIGGPASILSFANSWAILSGGMATCKREANYYPDEQVGDIVLGDNSPDATLSDTALRAATYARVLMRQYLATSVDDLEQRRQLLERFITALFLLRLKIRLEFAWDGPEIVTLRKGGLPRILPTDTTSFVFIGFQVDLHSNDTEPLHKAMLAAGVDIMAPAETSA